LNYFFVLHVLAPINRLHLVLLYATVAFPVRFQKWIFLKKVYVNAVGLIWLSF